MWIEQSKDKFRACAYYTDPLTGKRHKIGVTMDKNTPQARNKASKQLDTMILDKLAAVPDVMYLDDLIWLYVADLRNTVKPSTLTRNEYACKRFRMMLGNCDVNKLAAGLVKRRIVEYNSNPTTVNEHIQRFKAFMRWAYRNDYVKDISWLDKLTKLKDESKRAKVADKYLEAAECDTLINAMANDQWRDLTRFLILSGLRVGEALALDETDLDFEQREINVTKTLDANNHVVTSTKTATSTRRVYMQDDLHALSRSLCVSNRFKRKMLYLDRSPLFFALNGSYASYNNYLNYLKRVSVAALGRKITAHTLRHTHASLLSEQGFTLDEISRRLGHADSRITRDIYIHITEKKRAQENERLRKVHLF